MPDQPPRTNLPAGIPDALKDFIRCTSNEVELEAGDLDWLPKPDTGGMPVPDVTPGLTFEAGPTPGSVTISVGWGFFGVSVTGTIQDGKLNVESPPIPGLGPQITNWVNDLNADLESNGMQLGDLSIRNGKLHFGKEKIPPVEETETAVESVPLVAVTSPTPTPIPTPPVGSRTASFLDDWKGKAAVGTGALALGVAAFFLFVDNGAPVATAPSIAAPAATGEETPPSEATDEGASTDDSGTDVEEDVETPEDSAAETDESVGSLMLPDDFFGGLDRFAEDAGATGEMVMIHTDPSGDTDFCTESDALGADLTGVVAYQDGNMVSAFVGFGQSPTISLGNFSWAAQFQVEFASGSYRSFMRQVHNGEHSEGEQLSDGTMAASDDVTISVTDMGVLFMFEVDESDPLAVGTASGFNLPNEGDAIGCDQAVAAVSAAVPLSEDRQGDCTPSDTTMCLNERFAVTADFTDGTTSGSGLGFAQTGNTGWLTFADPNAVDVRIQVFDGCTFGDHFWVFASGLTTVAVDLTVTDTVSGETQVYSNPLGEAFNPITDTSAFATCP